jgi:integrase
MTGSIRRRGKMTWELTFDLGPDPVTGDRMRRFVSVKGTRSDAEKALTEAIHRRNTGLDISYGKLTVTQYLNRWMADYATNNVSAATLVRYKGIITNHLVPAIGRIQLSELRPAHIQRAYAEDLKDGGRKDRRGGALSARTVLQHHRVLREALAHAVRWQLIARNPADAVSPPKPSRHEMRVLDREEAQKLLASCSDDPLHCLLHVALTTGARLGELLALRWSDIDAVSGTLRITRSAQRLPRDGIVFHAPKTHRSIRPIALSPVTLRILRTHRISQAEQRLAVGSPYTDRDLVFANVLGEPLDGTAVTKRFQQLALAADLGHLRFHDLRHTAATLMLSAGTHPKIVSERLGHATINITLDTYSHVLPDMQHEAARMLDALLTDAI